MTTRQRRRQRRRVEEGQEFLPGTMFMPCERWCRFCGEPVFNKQERDRMMCLNCKEAWEKYLEFKTRHS